MSRRNRFIRPIAATLACCLLVSCTTTYGPNKDWWDKQIDAYNRMPYRADKPHKVLFAMSDEVGGKHLLTSTYVTAVPTAAQLKDEAWCKHVMSNISKYAKDYPMATSKCAVVAADDRFYHQRADFSYEKFDQKKANDVFGTIAEIALVGAAAAGGVYLAKHNAFPTNTGSYGGFGGTSTAGYTPTSGGTLGGGSDADCQRLAESNPQCTTGVNRVKAFIANIQNGQYRESIEGQSMMAFCGAKASAEAYRACADAVRPINPQCANKIMQDSNAFLDDAAQAAQTNQAVITSNWRERCRWTG